MSTISANRLLVKPGVDLFPGGGECAQGGGLMLNHTTEKRGNGNLELWATGPLDPKAQRRCGGGGILQG